MGFQWNGNAYRKNVTVDQLEVETGLRCMVSQLTEINEVQDVH